MFVSLILCLFGVTTIGSVLLLTVTLKTRQACKTATSVRSKVKASFEDENSLRMFSNVEVFLSTFSEDQNIVNGLAKLCHTLFPAIEEGIAFFIEHRSEQSFPTFHV